LNAQYLSYNLALNTRREPGVPENGVGAQVSFEFGNIRIVANPGFENDANPDVEDGPINYSDSISAQVVKIPELVDRADPVVLALTWNAQRRRLYFQMWILATKS
jgi:hypothetical protein